jgi:hypothetical protein
VIGLFEPAKDVRLGGAMTNVDLESRKFLCLGGVIV